jgi:hypothetical protein
VDFSQIRAVMFNLGYEERDTGPFGALFVHPHLEPGSPAWLLPVFHDGSGQIPTQLFIEYLESTVGVGSGDAIHAAIDQL